MTLRVRPLADLRHSTTRASAGAMNKPTFVHRGKVTVDNVATIDRASVSPTLTAPTRQPSRWRGLNLRVVGGFPSPKSGAFHRRESDIHMLGFYELTYGPNPLHIVESR